MITRGGRRRWKRTFLDCQDDGNCTEASASPLEEARGRMLYTVCSSVMTMTSTTHVLHHLSTGLILFCLIQRKIRPTGDAISYNSSLLSVPIVTRLLGPVVRRGPIVRCIGLGHGRAFSDRFWDGRERPHSTRGGCLGLNTSRSVTVLEAKTPGARALTPPTVDSPITLLFLSAGILRNPPPNALCSTCSHSSCLRRSSCLSALSRSAKVLFVISASSASSDMGLEAVAAPFCWIELEGEVRDRMR